MGIYGKISFEENTMRKFSKLSIVVSHEGDENSVFSAPVVELTSGNTSVQMSDFESTLAMLPPGSEVSVVAKGTVGNNSVHNLARIIREGCVFVALDLSSVQEFSRVIDSPFRANPNLVGIIFPNNLLSINEQAFADCKNLEFVEVPASVKKIGKEAFFGCEKLSKMEFKEPEGWFVEKDGENQPIENLHKSEDNPYRFTLPSSPYRSCIVYKA